MCPNRPVTQQAAAHTNFSLFGTDRENIRCQQIQHNIVVISCVKRNRSIGFTHGPNHIQRPIAIERGDLDGHDILNLGKFTPKSEREHTTANGRLQVEPYNRDCFRNCAAMVAASPRHRHQSRHPGSADRRDIPNRPATLPLAEPVRFLRRFLRFGSGALCGLDRRDPSPLPPTARPVQIIQCAYLEWQIAWCVPLQPCQPRLRLHNSE